MKRWLLLSAVLFSAGAVFAAAQLAIQLRTAKVRGKPEFLGPVVATLQYGDKIEQLGTQAGWLKVRTADGKEGWLHESALGKASKVEAGATKAGSEASADEVALAGKGFNEQVEQQYASEHKELNFAQVDQMEKTKASDAELRKFAEEGGLLEGGAK